MITTLISFGWSRLPIAEGHPIPPPADRIEDVRHRLRKPAAPVDVLELDGLDPQVQAFVINIPGARGLICNLVSYAMLGGPTSIAVGSVSGRYRAPGLVEVLAQWLRNRDRRVEVEHLHAHLSPDVGDSQRRPW